MTLRIPMLILLAALLVPTATAQADGQAHHTLRAQETSQQMNMLADRSWALLQDLERQRRQLQGNQVRAQYRHLWQFGEHLHEMAMHIEGALARYRLLVQDQHRNDSESQQMEQEMDRLLDHLQAMASDLEASYQAMEQIVEQYSTLTAVDSPPDQ